ncbi:MAG: TetM/TetW/TetO/TetS family tetracycline resistance ribosomal protection protein [Lachnospiraceae bacterium]|nr:TetM/TetW/TetO/TetS family tetracycline resistance ribosomal protection protein [Lachnospiraceae bacterium]
MKNICVGIVAHVDSGKTTLSENILYTTGSIRNLGRVDHKNTFLDTYSLERERGITIFSKQAQFVMDGVSYTLLDTPGHVDFSAEMERTLQVLDYGILIVSGADGIQGHTLTLWKLLLRYNIPTFIFVNKMDQQGLSKEKIMEDLQGGLSSGCLDMDNVDYEDIAVLDENLMERFLESGTIDDKDIAHIIKERKLFPCYFGSALKGIGIEEFLGDFRKYTAAGNYGDEFAARVFKITRDNQGNRLTHMKITGGSLKVKDYITYETADENQNNKEKVDQIRVYSGDKFTSVNRVEAGEVCAVTGLTMTAAGAGLGAEKEASVPYLEPVLNYRIIPPAGIDVHNMLLKLRQLQEEEPQLNIRWDEELSEIHANVMGEIEIEILKNLISERFGLQVEFGSGNIVYKESIKDKVIGVGHYEPLRHYAEVQLLLEPGEAGSGLKFDVDCSEDKLSKNWQRLILTHLYEKEHRGVLTGSAITDMKITLVAGKAHLKHTEGGDFRQATYRAVRQGLRKAESILLEPVYEFRLELPSTAVGRALSDIQRMCGKNNLPDMEGDMAIITGVAPVATMREYQSEVNAYTGGRGKLFLNFKGYEPCHNADEIIEEKGYNPEADINNPTGSVFCAHGAGFVVDWNEVDNYKHIQLDNVEGHIVRQSGEEEYSIEEKSNKKVPEITYNDKELEAIFERTYGPIDRNKDFNNLQEYDRLERERERLREENAKLDEKIRQRYIEKNKKTLPSKDKYLLVDGYNIIFAWNELKELAKLNLDSARMKLMDIMCNYQGYKGMTLILVFDAYKVQGGRGSVQKYNNIHVIYTKEAETADQYIEKAVHKLGKKNDVTVATSDALEQMIIWGEGARRMSARELEMEILNISKDMEENYLGK